MELNVLSQASEAPNKEKKVSNSFSVAYEAGQGPQELRGGEAGYLGERLAPLQPELRLEAYRALRSVARTNRQKMLNRRRVSRHRRRKREELAILNAPVHPTLSRQEALAVEEAAGLA